MALTQASLQMIYNSSAITLRIRNLWAYLQGLFVLHESKASIWFTKLALCIISMPAHFVAVAIS